MANDRFQPRGGKRDGRKNDNFRSFDRQGKFSGVPGKGRHGKGREWKERDTKGGDLKGRSGKPASFKSEKREEIPVTRKFKTDVREIPTDIVYGKNAVYETLQAGTEANKLVVIRDSRDHAIQHAIDICKERKIPIKFSDKSFIDSAFPGVNHQGIVLYTAPYEYVEVVDILRLAEQRNEAPFVVILDGITDPHNLGAIIRTADAVGVHGVIIPKHESATVTDTVVKTSSGAVQHVLVSRVTNLVQTIKKLKEEGVWVVGTAVDGEKSYTQFDLKGALALVIGSEGDGMSRLVKENCDANVHIPMFGKVNSLNASVAAGVVLFEAVRQRRSWK